MTSSQIVECLRASHTNDVFVTECKDGPTWTTSHARMDVWTMKRSWSKPCISGYEIKCSKSDFRNDQKWPAYLPLCNQFYFACPKGLISLEEMPPEAGLVYCSGTRMRVVKKAAWREVVLPESLVLYLLMCRTRIVEPNYHADDSTHKQKLDRWREWVAQKEESAQLGYQISRKVRDYVDKVEAENRRFKDQNETFAEVKAAMGRMNIPLHGCWNLEDRLKAVQSLFPPEVVGSLKDCQKVLAKLIAEVETKTPLPKSAG